MSHTRLVMSLLARISPPHALIALVAIAAGTTFYVTNEMESRIKAAQPAPLAETPHPRTNVVFCAKNIKEGETIRFEDLEVRQVDAAKAPIDAISEPNDAIGHPAKFTLLEGLPVAAHDLAPVSGTVGFQAKLRPGERAVTLAVDSNTGVAGFIQPDSHVDVMVQVGNGADTKTKAILSDVRVVASGTTYQKPPGSNEAQPTSNVTIAVNPEEASKVINGMSAGKIYLTLRSDFDHSPVAVSEVNSLFRKPTPALIANIPEPPLPPPQLLQTNLEPEKADKVDSPQMNSLHEIEQWQADKRDITSVRHE